MLVDLSLKERKPAVNCILIHPEPLGTTAKRLPVTQDCYCLNLSHLHSCTINPLTLSRGRLNLESRLLSLSHGAWHEVMPHRRRRPISLPMKIRMSLRQKPMTTEKSVAACHTKVRRSPGPWRRRDVKNEGRSGDVYENTREWTKCQGIIRAFCRKNRSFATKDGNRSGLWAENTRITP